MGVRLSLVHANSDASISHNAGSVQTTQTNEFTNAKWVKSLHPGNRLHKPISPNHYRLVTKGAGFSLSTFKGMRELLSATLDILIGNVHL